MESSPNDYLATSPNGFMKIRLIDPFDRLTHLPCLTNSKFFILMIFDNRYCLFSSLRILVSFYMRKLLFTLVIYVLPRPLGRAVVGGLTFLGMLSKKQFLGPRNLQMAIPSGCDHACEFCITDIHGKGAPKNRQTLSFEELTAQVDSALEILCLNINLVSTGEPTLYPKLTDLIDHIWKKSRGRATIKIVTNGTSLWKFSPEYFRDRNVVLWLSLHSGLEENWKSIHMPLSQADEKFSRMREWLIWYNRIAPESVTLHNVISKQNQDYLDSILAFARETRSRDVFFGRLYGFPHLQLSASEEKSVLEKLLRLEPSFKDLGIRTNVANFKFVAISQDEDKGADNAKEVTEKILSSRDFYKSHDCYITWLFSTVDDTGQLLACGKGRLIGNTRQTPYEELFLRESPKLIEDTTNISKRGTSVPGCHCLDCPHIQMNVTANKYLRLAPF